MHATATLSFRSARSSAPAARRGSAGAASPSRKSSVESEALDQYLREISAYPLIDRAMEAVLAQRIRAGDAEALDTLVRSNLRFVVSVAKRYQNQGVSLADLINEGNIGLMRAAQKFDETKGIKFISYAVWWIRQAILQALAEQSRIVRVPLSRAGTLHRIGRRSSTLTQELGREPTLEEIAGDLDLPEEEIKHTLAMAQTHLSLDAPLVPGEDGQLLDYLCDHVSAGPDEELYTTALTHTIGAALSTLSEREAQVLRYYFGLGDTEPRTLEQIGEQFGITRERVRQIKERALGRLRHQSRARFLQTFLP
jgi:RNA polymerase primary sigma factor